jgi:transposase InsO family protein
MYEELRSLDPRQRRRVEQRLAVLAYASTCSMHAAALFFGLSYRTVRRWRYRYRQGGIRGLVPRYRAERRRRITPDVRELIRVARTEHQFGSARTKVWLQRVHGLYLGSSTIQLVFRQLGLRRLRRTPKRRPRQLRLFSKDTPGDSIQVDVKFVRINRQRCFQYTALDDCTRFRVLRLYRYLNARTSLAFLAETRQALPFPIRQIQSDHGTEFPLAFRLSVEALGIRHRYIRPRRPQQNGKVERSHRIDHDEFWSRRHFNSFDEAADALRSWERFYNVERFSLALHGRTPAEMLADRLPGVLSPSQPHERRPSTAPS